MTREEFFKIDSDISRGVLSGIPPCCIAFFVEVWQPLVMNLFLEEDDKRTTIIRRWKDAYSPYTHGWGYVPCPDCKWLGNRVEIIRHEPKRKTKRTKEEDDLTAIT